jgi:plastocyanin
MKRTGVMVLFLVLGCGDEGPTVVVPAAVDGALAPDMTTAPVPDMAMAVVPPPAAAPDMAMAVAPPDMAMAPAPQIVDVAVGPAGTNSFSPSAVSIRVGGTVRWTWQTGIHSVTSGTPGAADGQFCSLSGTPSAAACNSFGYATSPPFTYEHTFGAAGTFPYFCTIHGAAMTGTVTVSP